MKIFIRSNHINIILAGLALFYVVLHLLVSYNLEYHRDELLYFSLGRHPAFGYATVPPLSGWIAWLMQNIFGYSLFAVRIFPAVSGGVMVFLVAAIAKELGGSDYSRILASTGIIVSVFGLRTYLMFQPVHLDIFFWTLSFYLIIKYINTQSGKYLIILGIAAGFGFLNKYLIGLLFIIVLIIIPFTRYRNLFTNRKFWYGILAGALVFLPNAIWQVANGLPVIDHIAELKRTQLVYVDRVAFLIEQAIIPGAATILTVMGLLFIIVNRSVRKFRFLGVTIVFVIAALMMLRGKSYYTIGVFPFLIAAGAVGWERLFRKALPRFLLIMIIIIISLPMVPIGIPIYKTEGLVRYFDLIRSRFGMDFVTRFEDNSIHPLPQDYSDMLGWEELTAIVNRGWHEVADKKSGFIYCENYGQAGAVTVIGRKYGLPEAVSLNESFKYWIPKQFDKEISAVIYVNNELGDDVDSLFRKKTIIGSISNPYAREFGTTVYLCQDPVSSFNDFWAARINEIH